MATSSDARSRGDAPDVSIVIPLGRDSPYLRDAVASVRAQTFARWELVVVDNGATDPGAVNELLADDLRMRIVSIDHRATAARAQNVGVGATSGDLITFLGDDDVWVPERLEKQVAVHAANPQAPASYCALWYMDANGEPFGSPWRSRQASSSEMIRGAAPTPFGGTLMVTRNAWSAVGGFSPEVPTLEDFELPLRLAMLGDLIYVDETLYGYRRHDHNLTSTNPEDVALRRMVMDRMIVRQRWAAEARGDEEVARWYRERLHRYRRDQSRQAGVAVLRNLRRSHARIALADTAWGATHAPIDFARGLGSTLARKLRRRSE